MRSQLHFFALLQLALIVSCSTLGTSGHVYKPQLTRQIRKIGIAPYDLNIADMISIDRASCILDKNILNKQENSKLFSILPRSEFLKHTNQSFATNRQNILKIGKKMEIDAVVFCDLILIPRDTVGMQWTDAAVHLKIIHIKTGELIAESEHNTITGNSYWMPPKLEQAITDAAIGSSNGLINCISSVYN